MNPRMKYYHIHFQNGYTIECYRQRKPIRLAAAFSRKRAANGSLYGLFAMERGIYTRSSHSNKL